MVMHKNRSVSTHDFAMIPRAEIPRSSFVTQSAHKTTFDSGWLVPIYVDEVLPGDTHKMRMTAFTRLATPLFPTMDNLIMETFFFFVPNRLVWSHWEEFMGYDPTPGVPGPTYTVPQVVAPAGGWATGSPASYMGCPIVGQLATGATVSHTALYLRAYQLIWNEWFRDENLQTPLNVNVGDGPDTTDNYIQILRRGKRKDYFTGALPWPQKGEAVTLPLGSSAPVISNGQQPQFRYAGQGSTGMWVKNVSGEPVFGTGGLNPSSPQQVFFGSETGLMADLSQATAATINQIRQAFQIQKLLERDARGGTRYTEIIRAHFGVISPDARLQRPEYIGGGSSPININPIAQTSATVTGETPLGNLAAMGTGLAHNHGFTYSSTEHGMIIGLVSVRADLTYQQGLPRMFSRKTRYDYYFPVFSHLGEQPILNKEIYCRGDANDDLVFGYQERWAEYRYRPSMITGLFNSRATGTLDAWHYGQNFSQLPVLNSSFIVDNPPVDRTLAVPGSTLGDQFLCDIFFENRMARPMPMYSVPGLVDHF